LAPLVHEQWRGFRVIRLHPVWEQVALVVPQVAHCFVHGGPSANKLMVVVLALDLTYLVEAKMWIIEWLTRKDKHWPQNHMLDGHREPWLFPREFPFQQRHASSAEGAGE
jgi:hypothetical protein